ncbi:MAG: cytochrome P450 [Crocinitomicaceae bacterium]|nr:cytochrome P450 [Crocinitomicaceae bacterium]
MKLKTLKDLKGPKGYPFVGNIPRLDVPNIHRQFEDWSDEFGDVFRLNLGFTSQTVVTRPSIIQHIYRDRPDGFIRAKKMDSILRDGGVHGLFNAEGEEWELHRKILAKGLDVKHQKQFYPAMLKVIERLYNKWSKDAETGEPFDIQRDLLRFTVDVTASLAFGIDMNTLEQTGGAIQDHMDKVFPMIFKRINQPILLYKYFKTRDDKDFDAAVAEMNKLIDVFIQSGKDKIKANPALKANPSNVLEAILNAAEEEGDFGTKEVRGNLLTLLLAGEDTTAHTLSWMIFLLTQHSDAQEGLRTEADEILGAHSWMTAYDLQGKLRYTDATAMESMRFKPVAPGMLFQATRDVVIEEFKFVEGQKVIIQTRAGAMKEENFTEAESFNPKRWLKESRCPIHNTDASSPFGGGARFCPGRNLAMLEIKMVISMLFKNFNIEMVTDHSDIREVLAFTMMASDYKVRLSKRT